MTLQLSVRQSFVLVQWTKHCYRSLHCLSYVIEGKCSFGGSQSRRKWVGGAQRPSRSSTRCSTLLASFSTTPSTETNSSIQKDKESFTWLYKRTPDTMLKPRVILGLASFHTLYWSWYVFDFIPAVNQSPLENLHIDPVVGYVGMLFSVFVNLGAALYPYSLVSSIGLKGGELCVFCHSLPTMKPAKKGVMYEIGHVTMDPSTEETKKIVDTLHGDLSAFRGFVALKANRRRLPYLFQIENPNEILDSWRLLQIFINPEVVKKDIKRSSYNEEMKRSGKRANGRKRVWR